MAFKFMKLSRSMEPEDRFQWEKDVRVKVKAAAMPRKEFSL
jgi:hypothetical protein